MASIQKRGKNSWLLVVETGYVKGKRKKRTRTVHIEDPALLKTKKRLQEHLELELAKFKIEVESGEYIAPEKMRLQDFVEEWNQKFAQKKLGIKTRKEQLGLMKNHISPNIGHMRLDSIKPIHIVNFLHQLEQGGSRLDGKTGGLADSTIYQVDKALRSLFSRAKEWKLIKDNPMKELSRPKIMRKEMNYLDENGTYLLLTALNEIEMHWRLFFITSLIGGLRRGEIVALEWKHINFEENYIDVEQSIPLFEDGQPVIKETKTGVTRKVSMPEWYMNELRDFKEEWEREKDGCGDCWEGGVREFVFQNGLGLPFYPTTATKRWIEFRNEFKFEGLRLHDMRHTMVALLIEEGVHLKAIQKRAGHANYKTTSDTYGHVSKKVADSTAKRFEKFNPSHFVNNSSTDRKNHDS
ncbi:tyrosine-type recombinase/integrase [Bacillus benzoevorans]